ncbi:MAG: electron transport complex subunit RsxG [Methylococcales bacterium]|nr:electron transport complex subunit RsxG [Methylococcales bacterium]
MKEIIKKSLTGAQVLGLFSLLGLGLVVLVAGLTEGRIAANERQALLDNLVKVVPADLYDNDIASDVTTITDLTPELPVTVYRARQQGEPVAAVFTIIATNGYNGDIKLLVAVHRAGYVTGVRAVAHKETPGLGDGIEANRSQWIYAFDGKSLANPKPEQWAVKRDGGVFDQFTGATITPRAVVNAVKKVLIYFKQHQDKVFSPEQGA